MSKERLEEIEKNLDPLGYGMGGHLISVNDIYWLVRYAKEQSERVQELEKENRRYRKVINNIIEKTMLFGVDEQVFEAIKEANRVLEGHE